jgi:hypothetical protein
VTIVKHYCLDGEHRLGQEFDCPKCRVLLLEAFRSAPEAPDPLEEAKQRHPSGRLPHLSVPADSARTVDLYREPDDRRTDPFTEEQENPAHITEHGVDPDPDQPGGEWFVHCSCGWIETGHYARDGMGETTAGRLAKIKAQKHRDNPEDDQ